MSLDARRACVRAGGRAGTLENGLLRHGLGEGDVGRSAGNHVGVELVRDGDGAGRLTQLAASAGCLVDEARLAADVGLEVSVGVARDAIHLGIREGGHVGVVDRGRHLGGGDAAGAVEGREDLAEQDHSAADASLLLDEEDFVAHIPELEGRLHAGDAAADDQGVILSHRLAPVDRSATSASENWFMCLAKFSAQTEQIAAIFRRCGASPSALSRFWASSTILEARLAQSGR